MEVGGEEEELGVVGEAAEIVEGGGGGLDAGAANYNAGLHGGNESGGVGQVAGGLDLEAGALEDGGHEGEEITGRVDAEDFGVRGPGMLFVGAGRWAKEASASCSVE